MPKCIVILTVFLFACSSPVDQTALEVRVFASNYPLSYFAGRISGDPGMVHFPKIDGDPAFWRPTTEDIITAQKSSIILLNGAGYETWRTSVSLPLGKIVDTSTAFQRQFLLVDETVDHVHGPGGAHSHSGTAFTTWIDLNQAAFQAKAVKDALAKHGVVPGVDLAANFKGLFEDLKRLDTAINEMSRTRPGMLLLASHPVYQYLARRYGLNIRSVMWEPDVFPDEQMWTELEELVQAHPAEWMLWEGEPTPESAARLKKMGIESIVFNPCGNRPVSGDFLTVMKQNVENLRNIFELND